MMKRTFAALLLLPIATAALAQRETPPSAATVALPDAGAKPPLIINIPGLPAGTQPPVEIKPVDPSPAPSPAAPALPPAAAAQAAIPSIPAAPAAQVAAAAAPAAVQAAQQLPKTPASPPGPTVAMVLPAAPPPSWPPPPPAAVGALTQGPAVLKATVPAPAHVAAAQAPAPAQLPEDSTGLTPPAQPTHPWVRIDSVEKLARDLQDVVTFLDRGRAYLEAYRKAAGGQESPRFKAFLQAYQAERAIGRQEAETLRHWFVDRSGAEHPKTRAR